MKLKCLYIPPIAIISNLIIVKVCNINMALQTITFLESYSDAAWLLTETVKALATAQYGPEEPCP
jgi:hypothetical protein